MSHIAGVRSWHPGPAGRCGLCGPRPAAGWRVVLLRSNGRYVREWPAWSRYHAKQVRGDLDERYDAGYRAEIRLPQGAVLS